MARSRAALRRSLSPPWASSAGEAKTSGNRCAETLRFRRSRGGLGFFPSPPLVLQVLTLQDEQQIDLRPNAAFFVVANELKRGVACPQAGHVRRDDARIALGSIRVLYLSWSGSDLFGCGFRVRPGSRSIVHCADRLPSSGVMRRPAADARRAPDSGPSLPGWTAAPSRLERWGGFFWGGRRAC